MTSDPTGPQPTVHAEEQKYTIAVAGKAAGFAEFADRGDQRVFYRTVVDPEFRGRGLASILVKKALEGARDDGKRIVPVCSMVSTVLKRHPEFDDITDPVTAEVDAWAKTKTQPGT
ncbi:GNAT family N-acetyltransferase [Mycobacterium spongiae]|uniref:GNAT family N-acetyltransferase n=1 Tax=Mycobacterium spongiae TaxID=886343 RepID=A0A975JU15_9MYCO|nr:GNAT family N-acetyltransferase [Mycobacterium spongiae]QUR65694.1 GNAT family N-acetyltransferase [Mycobacterium spongiae]